MISILIPVYNYDIRPLVHAIHKQLQELNVVFEICCLDDHSEPSVSKTNWDIISLPSTSYKISEKNMGREQTRQLLCERASFNHLLFLDADTIPVKENFIQTYLAYIDGDYDAIFGGIQYTIEPPSNENLLRWTYGTQNECQSAEQRNKNPYQSITSPNFIIRKNVFELINSKIEGKDYGYDVYFAKLMRQNDIKILHIDNEVFHLGLETSEDYLIKSEEALRTYLKLFSNKTIETQDNRMIATFASLKTWKLNYVLYGFYKVFGEIMKKNLLGKNPSVTLFQLYRLSYVCYVDIPID